MLGPVGERGARLLERLKTQLDLGEDERQALDASAEAVREVVGVLGSAA